MYLDNAATTQLKPKIKDYIISLLDTYQNPSSMYQSGVNAKQIINTARNNVAKFINANPEKYYFYIWRFSQQYAFYQRLYSEK